MSRIDFAALGTLVGELPTLVAVLDACADRLQGAGQFGHAHLAGDAANRIATLHRNIIGPKAEGIDHEAPESDAANAA